MLTILIGSLASFAQSEKYIKAMEALVQGVDTTRSIEGLMSMANSFERIANAEKNQWLPYYYAALAYVNMGNMYFQMQQPEKIDPIMDKAEPLLNKASELEKNNSEILLLDKMFKSAKMMADPMNRFMSFGVAAGQSLTMAKTLNPENPRVYLMEGIDKFYTPEQFGGSKSEGKKLFEEAAKKFQVFKPASSIHPGWGMAMTQYFLVEAAK
jgi:hypothetical protein